MYTETNRVQFSTNKVERRRKNLHLPALQRSSKGFAPCLPTKGSALQQYAFNYKTQGQITTELQTFQKVQVPKEKEKS